MTVSIDVDIDALDAKMEIANLKVMLESLGEDMDFDLGDALDGELGDTLENLSDTMDEISESFNADLNETLQRAENLEFDDINVVQGNGDSGGDTGSDSGDRIPSPRRYYSEGPLTNERTDTNSGMRSALNQIANADFSEVRDLNSLGQSFKEREERTSSLKIPGGGIIRNEEGNFLRRPHLDGDTPGGGMMGGSSGGIRGEMPLPMDLFDFGDDSYNDGFLNGVANKTEKVSEGIDGLSGSMRRAVPSMSTWINLVGMAVPALAALAVQAAGVASAFGAIGIAGASMIGLGLLGHGDSMAESFRNAGQEVDELKQSLFETFEPTADLFAGVQTEFFDYAPQALQKVSVSMRGLLGLKEEFFDMFNQATKFAAQFFTAIDKNESVISGLYNSFRGIIGTEIINLFVGLLIAAQKNKRMLKELGSTFKVLIVALYELFVMVSRTIVMLDGFFLALAGIIRLLNNPMVSALLATVVVIWSVNAAVSYLWTTLLGLGTTMLSSMIPIISAMVMKMATWIGGAFAAAGANTALAASIGLVTSALLTLMAVSGIGLLLSGAGLAISETMRKEIGMDGGAAAVGGSGRGSPTKIVNEGDTVNVDLSNADTSSIERFRDMRSGGGDRGPTGGRYTG